MIRNITFRTQLVGSVSEFCTESQLVILNDNLNLVELIVLLARYQEEGKSLCPNVYLTNEIQTLLSMIPTSDFLKIGNTSLDIEGIKTAIKKCAPLAERGWLLYLNGSTSGIEYGLFKGPSNPISVLVDDVIMKENADYPVVKVFQVASDCVEVRSNSGVIFNIFLNHRKENSSAPLKSLDSLVQAITKLTEVVYQEQALTFLNRLFFESLRNSHGCLIAVTDSDSAPECLAQDGIILDEPIDFYRLVEQAIKDKGDTSNLESKGALLQGMLNSDGITLFDSRSRLLGYNCFVKPDSEEETLSINGGARKRAFGSLSSKVGTELSAVFIQSQDGWTEYKGSNDE